ncbi:glutaredoxin [Bermanella marisrubri]|uniref:glutaredoxin family protein n=1 Tax=Bermanella marisrubri TaxID=207949 RepID=UPI000A05BBBD|nr:glutaredoxin [Bermanella marisrubri]QIZ83802.1 glutaredoxin [Bermanella marisrubri]
MPWLQKLLYSCSVMLTPTVKRSSKEQRRVEKVASGLTLYVSDTCPYCTKVKKQVKHLNIPLTIKNLDRCHIYQKELLSGGGKAQVPCLKIDRSKGVEWVYRSEQIANYMDKKFQPKAKQRQLERASG